VVTSAREFARQGSWRLFAKIVVCVVGFRLGIAPARLRRFYYGWDGNDAGGPDRPRIPAAGAPGGRGKERG